MTKILGIDEAGRGPVIGPLVMAGVLIKEEDLPKLMQLGVRDSKLLSAKQRENMFDKIIEIAQYKLVVIVPPKEIDDAVNGKDGLNLNWLEAVKTAEIINLVEETDKKLLPDKVIADCPSNNIAAFTSYIAERVKNKDIKLILEHKADEKYLSVSAASILAKVTRDREIEKIKQKINQNIGSGYPSDPATREFLKQNWDKYPEIFRKSWASYKNAAKEKNQKSLKQF